MEDADSDIFDVTSSPLQSPEIHPRLLAHEGTSQPDAAGSNTNGTSETVQDASFNNPQVPTLFAGNKRQATDDLAQFAEATGRRVKLKAEDHKELIHVSSKLSDSERNIYTIACVLKLRERFDTLQPTEALYTIPDRLRAKIEHYTFITITAHNLGAYVTDQTPNKIVLAILEHHSSAAWGISKEIKKDSQKMKVINSRVGDRMTDRRADLKSKVQASIGQDNIDTNTGYREGCQNILELCTSIVKVAETSGVQVTLPMCARVAFIRRELVRYKGLAKGFWTSVDRELERFRSMYSDDPEGARAIKISKLFSNVLKKDLDTYGLVSTNLLPRDGSTSGIKQRVVDAAVIGDFIDDDSI